MKTRAIVSLHLAFWTLKNGLEFLLFSLPYLQKEPPLVFWRNTLLMWAVYFLYFYTNYFLFSPLYASGKRLLSYLVWVLVTSIAFCLALSLIWNGYDAHYLVPSRELVSRLTYCCATNLFGCMAISLFEHWTESEKKKKDLEEEVRKTELLYLKSQMSPHFLFNTFNNIYGLAINKSPQTVAAIGQLKQMMLYVQNFKEGAKIYLEEEISTLRSFIALNALRYDCRIHFQASPPQHVLVEPMIFLPFIENAFKHGDTSENARIDIEVDVKGTTLHFRSENKIGKEKRKDDTGGIGLPNIKRRLDLLYGSEWSFETTCDHERYFVHLTLPLV